MRVARTFLAALVLAAAAFVAGPSAAPVSTDSQSWLIDWDGDGYADEAWLFYENGRLVEI